ncbi:MAG TPA: hypothetical protein VKF32_06445, partial [Thermoanaerobaculia bacterium]|nr:hypothetical protein [Thermoanaerobaculia bacterium]
LVGSAASPLSELAFALDQAINNTSLVLMLTYFGSTLLLPGDAQYGNWRFWLEDAGSDALLKTVVFYKVSHHGSINATPKQVVDALPKGKFAAMVSTQSEPWPSIPRMPLLKKLTAASRGLVRSDCISVSGAPAAVKMSRPPSGFTRGAFWVDYEVP